MEIGAHTRTHPDLGKVTDAETLFDEVVTARDELEKEIDCKINYFAFPFGQMENLSDEAIQLAKTHGFKGVCSAYGGLNSVGDNPFHIHRLHGDSETIRLKNWLSLDPRVLLAKKYQLPELPESTNETSNQEASDETKSDQVAATSC